jgi:hypothetical protein
VCLDVVVEPRATRNELMLAHETLATMAFLPA